MAKRCVICKAINPNPLIKTCSYDCASAYLKSDRGIAQKAKTKIRLEKKAESKKRREWKDRKTKLRGTGHQNELTQTVINQYVRLEAKANNRNCISCDKPIDYVTKVRGGTYDAGHYKTVKAHPELRFNLKNNNAEHKYCNHHDDQHLVGMRVNIVKRFGRERLDWLDGPHASNHYTIDWHIRCRELLREKMRNRGWL